MGKSGPRERVQLANQIQGFRIPEREKNNNTYCLTSIVGQKIPGVNYPVKKYIYLSGFVRAYFFLRDKSSHFLIELFGAKDPIPAGLRSRVIYKFSCAVCCACYIGETNRHFATRIREHLASDKNSHIFKHL